MTEQEMLTVSTPTGTMNPADWFVQSFGINEVSSGVNVTTNNVLTSGPVYQATTTIAGDLAGMEIQFLRSDLSPDQLHPGWTLLNESAHEEIGSFTFRETLMSWALLHGNGIAYIEFDGGGRPVSLIPLHPECTQLWRDPDTSQLLYVYSHPEGGGRFAFLPNEVLHFRGLGTALWGHSIFDLMRNAVGNAMAAEKFQGKAFGNSITPTGAFTKDGPFPAEARAELREELNRFHTGVNNAARALILSHGLKYQPMGITHRDAELLESIKFSREQIAAFFCLPPYKLGSLENSAVRANLEQSQREYLQSTLWRWICIQQNEVCRKLLSTRQRERRTHCVRFNTDALVAADQASRYASYNQGIVAGWMSPNEARKRENLPPIEGGDVYLIPLNCNPYGPDAAIHEASRAGTTAPTDELPPTQEPVEPDADDNMDEPVEDMRARLRGYVGSQLQRLRKSEVNRLTGEHRKIDSQSLSAFYAKHEAAIVECLEPTCGLFGFVGREQLTAIVADYCKESLRRAIRCDDMAYEDREKELIDGIQDRNDVTVPC